MIFLPPSPMLWEMYVVLTGDIVASRAISDREGLLQGLLQAMERINGSLAPWVLSSFRVVRGDEFQGLISSLGPVPMAIFDLKAWLLPWKVRIGVGAGGISTRVVEDVSLMDGEAFRRAAEALQVAREARREVVFRTGLKPVDEVAEMIYPLMETIWGRWREELWQRCLLFLEGGSLKGVAEEVGVSYQAIHKEFQRSGVMRVLEVMEKFQRWLEGRSA